MLQFWKKPGVPMSKLLDTNCNEELFLTKILVGSTFNCPPDNYLKCRLSFICLPDEVDKIHVEFDEISLIATLIIDTETLKEIIFANIFSFKFSFDGENFYMNVYFKDLPLKKFNTKIGNCLKDLFITANIITLDIEKNIDNSYCGTEGIKILYESLPKLRTIFEPNNLCEVQNIYLKPKLRPYQKRAVAWMLKREKCSETEEILHPLYSHLKLPSGFDVYFDKFSGFVQSTKPLMKSIYRGGILAEEMGLGKTVEFLSLILNNPHPKLNTLEFSNESDDDDDLPLSHRLTKIPSIQRIPKQKKRRIAVNKMKQHKDIEYEEKDVIVSTEFAKSIKEKSNVRAALQLYYDRALSEVNHKPLKHVELVECICGETYEDGKIKCEECGKFQHQLCLGHKNELGPFYCPSCWLNRPLIESSATLIVTPLSLRTQWCNEIKNHITKNLKVLVYEGSTKTPVYPTHFNNFDIVITTYNILQSEFRLTEKGQVFKLRQKRKYDFQGSSLARIKWWRLCLDEAQAVETPGRIVSAMARKLTSEFRWAVTGTPISKDVSDLYGLIDYLGVEPYNEFETWSNVLYNPFIRGEIEPLCSFLSRVMWRSSKAEVMDQIGIPSQTVTDYPLEFSAVEKFFYNKEHELSSFAFLDSLKNIELDTPLSKVDKKDMKMIMQPLLTLRQVCTYPNTKKGKYLATRKQVSTVKELLEALILKNSRECEEHLRVIVASLNGLAGLFLLMQNPIEAASQYRKIMHLSSRFSGDDKQFNLSVDKLQLIHTMHNLADIVETYENIPPTLHDSTLRDDCRTLEQKYIEKFINNSSTAYDDSFNSQSLTEKLFEQFILKEGQWYSDGFDWVTTKNLSGELVNKIRNTHDIAHVVCPVELSSERRILLFVAKWDEDVINSRADLIEIVNSLFTYEKDSTYKIVVNQKLVEKATDCHLRPEKKNANKNKKCEICVANDHLKRYEFKIFTMGKRTETYEEMSLQGCWKPTSQELILKSLAAVLKAKNAPESLAKDGDNHVNILDNLKKEFKEIRKLWTHIYQQVAAQDELDMCKIKLRLEDPNAKEKIRNNSKEASLKRLSYILENKLDTVHMVNESELDHHMMLLRSDETKGMTSLEKNLGVRNYLETLKTQQYDEGRSPDPCPVCRNTLEHHWSILSCGHNYCMECIHKLIEQISGLGSNITCCVCRQSQNIQDISYIKSGVSKGETDDDNIKGNFSTKIEAIIKHLLKLTHQEENVKVLIFSTWINVLTFLKEALELNGVRAEIVLNRNLEDRIERFKDEKRKITALLLPVNLGGKGLNLIEATHVILMEPLLNPGDELQAIGRVHRIGQTKPTFVHRFYVSNTIEESIFNATRMDGEKWDKNKVTLKQLRGLFKIEETVTEISNNDIT